MGGGVRRHERTDVRTMDLQHGLFSSLSCRAIQCVASYSNQVSCGRIPEGNVLDLEDRKSVV